MRNILSKILKNDFPSFLEKSFETLHHDQLFLKNWHLDLICEYLKAVTEGQIKRLIINIPPRSLKSICISVAWPAWLLAKNPCCKIISASYSQSLSVKHGIDCKKIITSKWYNDFFHDTKIIDGQNNKNRLVTDKGGFRLATSICGTLTGEGADFLIVDDPLTPMQALSSAFRNRANIWFEQTFTSRLNNPKTGSIVVVMQRLHTKDLTGFLIDKNMNEWHILNIPLIAESDTMIQFNDFQYHRTSNEYLHNDRYGAEEVESIKKSLGTYAFNAQYQQNPIALQDGIIKSNWLKYYDYAPHFEAIYQSWDCAIKTSNKNDYSVCTTWGVHNNQYYLIDVLKQRLSYPDLKRMIIANAEKFGPSAVIVEDKASGQQIIQELISNQVNIIKYLPKFDKATRLILVSNIFESGRVYIPNTISWLDDFFAELFSFPNCEHDDQVDSTVQFLEWSENKRKNHDKYLVRRI